MIVTKVPLRSRATRSEWKGSYARQCSQSDHRQDDEDGKGDDEHYRDNQMPRHSDSRPPHAKRWCKAAQSRAACGSVRKSAYVRDPLLGRSFPCSNRLRRQLEYCRFLTLKHLSEQQGLPVRKF